MEISGKHLLITPSTAKTTPNQSWHSLSSGSALEFVLTSQPSMWQLIYRIKAFANPIIASECGDSCVCISPNYNLLQQIQRTPWFCDSGTVTHGLDSCVFMRGRREGRFEGFKAICQHQLFSITVWVLRFPEGESTPEMAVLVFR